jgi:hypothetical protein
LTDEEILALADSMEGQFVRRSRTMESFLYDETQNAFWDVETATLLGDRAVDGAIPKNQWPTIQDEKGKPKRVPPSRVIVGVDTGLTVEGSTWWPGRESLIRDYTPTEAGLRRVPGAQTYNPYRAPDDLPIGTQTPDRWIEHVKMLYPDPIEHNHFFDYMAHAIQRPDEKPNHGIVMAGQQGIGKDMSLIPVAAGVGKWNVRTIDPDDILDRFNPYLRSVLLVINEVRPSADNQKPSNFYNLMKPILAAPPEMLPMNLKYANVIYVPNVAHVVVMTNHALALYIPKGDRRYFVMTSKASPQKPEYYRALDAYFRDNGIGAAVAWLRKRDLSAFDPKSPPPMTDGKQAIIDSAVQVRATIADEVVDRYLEQYGDPDVFFHRDLRNFITGSDWFDDTRAALKDIDSRGFHFKMEERGYTMVRNPHAKEWRSGKFRSGSAFVKAAIDRPVQAAQAELERR